MELSIDTSTRYASVGLSFGGETLAERTWRSERNHSVELVPTIRELMARVGVEMADLNAVFVAKGPGGFSALRVGMSTAKALATALSIPLFAVNSLDIEAHQYLGLNAPVCAIITAGRNRLYVGTYDGRAQPDGSTYEVISAEELSSRLRPGALLCGEAAYSLADCVREAHGDAVRLIDTPPPTRRAAMLAHLGSKRMRRGDSDDISAVQPLYLRSAQVNMARRTWAKR